MQPWPRVPAYELLQPLGGGPLTQVYAARRNADAARCAIKLARPEWACHPDAIRLLSREAAALVAIQHPHVVRLLDGRVSEPPHYLVFELVLGELLRDRLQRDFALKPRAAFWIARQVAEGLQAVHSAGFVHGDIKPDNVQLASAGGAVLLDLGFAHRPGDADSLEADGFVLGTANYLAPERAGAMPRDEYAGDWYSFGVMLFEMLTGQLPHPPRTLSDVLNAVRAAPDRTVADDSWPERLSALLGGLLEVSPAARPRGPLVIHELIALEIAALGHRRAG
jgi:serine/threonine protein kinase